MIFRKSKHVQLLSFIGLITLLSGSVQPQEFYQRGLGGLPEIFANERLDIVKLDPKHYTIDFENSSVRIIRAVLRPDEASPMHDDLAGVLVCPTECHIRFTRPDRKVQDVHLAAGESRWVYDDTRNESNLSNKTAEFLYIELKNKKN